VGFFIEKSTQGRFISLRNGSIANQQIKGKYRPNIKPDNGWRHNQGFGIMLKGYNIDFFIVFVYSMKKNHKKS